MQGIEFLQRRLERARAVSAEESPEAAAFAQSYDLLSGICSLLPLTARGEPALPADSPATQRRVLLALLSKAKADYLCPSLPVTGVNFYVHLVPYLLTQDPLIRAGGSGGGGGGGGDNDSGVIAAAHGLLELSRVLALYGRAAISRLRRADSADMLFGDSHDAVREARRAVALLEEAATRQAVSSQLQRLEATVAASDPPPLLQRQQEARLSANQLLHTACCTVLRAAVSVVEQHSWRQMLGGGGLPRGISQNAPATPELLQAAVAGRDCCAAIVQRLEPGSPKSWYWAGRAASSADHHLQAVRLHLRAYQLARQQRRGLAMLQSAIPAVTHYFAAVPSGVHPTEGVAALNAFDEAVSQLPRCKRLLPQAWVGEVEATLPMARSTIQRMQAGQAAGMRAWASGASNQAAGEAAAAAEAAVAAAAAAELRNGQFLERLNVCDGCGLKAMGLRMCSGCRATKYCSRECQKKHWRTHKQECRSAAGGADAAP